MGVNLIGRVVLDILRGRLVMRDQDPSLAMWKPSITGTPRLFRPELPQIDTLPDGYSVIK